MAVYGVRGQVEQDLAATTQIKLQEKGLSWAITRFAGRDAIVSGWSFSGEERDAALNLIEGTWGVRTVIDKSNLIASPETYSWYAVKDDKRIKLRGYVPSEESRRTVLGFVKAATPDLKVDDEMVVAGGSPPRQDWLGSVSFALTQLGQLKSGVVRLAGTDLAINGEAKTTASLHTLETALQTQLPNGMSVNRKDVAPPVAKPFTLRVKYQGNVVSLSGHVPSEKMHRQIIQRTGNLFPGMKIEDGLELASGMPEEWMWAVSTSLAQLHRLETGRIKFKDTGIEFEGVAPDKETAEDVVASLRNALPSSYSSSEKVSIRE